MRRNVIFPIQIFSCESQLYKWVCPSIGPSLHWSVRPSVHWSVLNLFFPRAETNTANNLCRVSGLVCPHISVQLISVCPFYPSVYPSMKTAAHAFIQDLQLDIGNTNGGLTVFFFGFLFFLGSNNISCFVISN